MYENYTEKIHDIKCMKTTLCPYSGSGILCLLFLITHNIIMDIIIMLSLLFEFVAQEIYNIIYKFTRKFILKIFKTFVFCFIIM